MQRAGAGQVSPFPQLPPLLVGPGSLGGIAVGSVGGVSGDGVAGAAGAAAGGALWGCEATG